MVRKEFLELASKVEAAASLDLDLTADALRGLRAALRAPGEGPVDVRDFVVGGHSP